MIELTRTNGDTILVNPDSIAMVEPIRGGTVTRLTVGRDTVDVNETIEQIKRLVTVTTYPAIETKDSAAVPISDEEAAKLPDAETKEIDFESMTRSEVDNFAKQNGLDTTVAKNKPEAIAMLKAHVQAQTG